MLKGKLRRFVQNAFDVNLTRRGEAWTLIEIEQLQRFIQVFAIDCVFDVGANEGQYAERIFETGFQGTVISFEPLPAAFAVLQKKAAGNSRWRVMPVALDEVSRDIEFNIMASPQFSSLHEPDHRSTDIFEDLNKVTEKILLKTTTIDEIYDGLRKELKFARPFLKMDTQGHDLAVVKGAAACIQKFAGLQSELAVTKLYDGAPSWNDILDQYSSLGFKLTALVPNNAGHFPDLHEVDCIMYNPHFHRS